ncbi:DJ-1/PfpI family protein [Plectosphaerella cucumerina]|uniref:DJ-1/PfpI family protein n=1 Tax=Plectosphaerella cucumerina TaxID=40658 RepID=A0A8K0T8J2_9PEZI|nr:DJ-1/PfpI family protein [Plectosphaerella cucumerina]
MSAPLPKSLRIGVMAESVQLADIMGIDIIGSFAKPDADFAAVFGDPALAELVGKMGEFKDEFRDIEWFFISSSLEPAKSTCGFKWLPNVTYDDCPRDLDIVLTGGPLPTHRPAGADRFIREAWPKTRVWLTTCVGSMWVASTGVLDGKKATTNQQFLDMAKRDHPKVDWLTQRWVIQEKEYEGEGAGEVWTGAGAASALDMITAFCMTKFSPELVNIASSDNLDLRPGRTLGQFY